MLTKRAIDLAYIAVTGGKETPDSDIWLADLRALLPAAVNFVLTGGIWEERRAYYEDMVNNGFAFDSTSELTQIVSATTQKDSTTGLYYYTLPNGVQFLPGGRGIRNAYSKDMSQQFVKARSAAHVIGLESPVFWWYEGGNKKVVFKNLSAACDVKIELIYAKNSLEDTDELPVMPGKGLEVVNILREWFVQQRQLPADYLNDDADGQQNINPRQRN